MMTPHILLDAAGLACAGGSLLANTSYYLALGKQNKKETPSKVFAVACGVSFIAMSLNAAHAADTEIFTAIILGSQLARTATAISIERDKHYEGAMTIKEILKKPIETLSPPVENIDNNSELPDISKKITRNQRTREIIEFSCVAGAVCVSLFQHPELAVAFLLPSTGLSLYRLHNNLVPKLGVHAVQKGVRMFIPVMPELAVVSEIASYFLLANLKNNNTSNN